MEGEGGGIQRLLPGLYVELVVMVMVYGQGLRATRGRKKSSRRRRAEQRRE